MKLFRVFLLLVFVGLLGTSCSNSSNVVSNSIIQKRKHNKGFFVNLKKPTFKKDFKTELAHLPTKVLPKTSNEPIIQEPKIKSEPVGVSKRTNSGVPTQKSIVVARQAQTHDHFIQEITTEPLNQKPVSSVSEPQEKEPNAGWSSAAIMSLLISTVIPLFFLFAIVSPFSIGTTIITCGIAAIILGIIAVVDILNTEKEGKRKKGYTAGMLGIIFGFVEVILMALLFNNSL